MRVFGICQQSQDIPTRDLALAESGSPTIYRPDNDMTCEDMIKVQDD